MAGILTGIVDADPRACGDLVRLDGTGFFEPDTVAAKILTVECAINAEGDAEFARAGGEILIFHLAATGTNDVDAIHRFDRANEDSVRVIGRAGDDIELVVHPIHKEHIDVPGTAVHHLVALGATATERVSGSVSNAEICLCLNDHSRDARAVGGGHDKQCAEQIAGDRERVFAFVKLSRNLHKQLLRYGETQILLISHRPQGNFMYRAIIVFLLLAAASVTAQKPDDVLATATGRTFKLRDLSPEVQKAVANLPLSIATARTDLFAQFVNQRLIDLEAASLGVSSGKFIWNEKAKVKLPTEAEIKAVYDANQQALGGRPLPEVREQIVDYLRADPQQKMFAALFARLRTKFKFSAGKDVNALNLTPADVIATLNGKPATVREFEDFAATELREGQADLGDIITDDLTDVIRNALIADEAKAAGIDAGTFIAREITNKMKDFSDEERTNLEDALAQRLFAKYQVKIIYAVPEAPIENVSADDDPALGAANAPVKVIMFSDFQCSACAATHPMLKRVIAGFDGKVRFVVRDFPLESVHGNSFDAARAAGAANAQGKFFEYIELLYKNQGALDAGSLKKYAAQIGLNAAQFDIDFNSERTAAEVRKDMADGEALGISGTPTIFVNGRRVRNISPESIASAIEAAIPK